MLKAKVHSAGVMDRDGVELLLGQNIKDHLPRLKHVWLDSGYKGEGKGKQWIEQNLGWSTEIVQHPIKPRGVWAPEDAVIDWSKIMPPPTKIFQTVSYTTKCQRCKYYWFVGVRRPVS